MRGATSQPFGQHRRHGISIHAPHAGSDELSFSRGITPSDFNPRSPCGERHFTILPSHKTAYFNPRSPCGERQSIYGTTLKLPCISIHAPHAGSDCIGPCPLLPSWISIHAPHAGSDRFKMERCFRCKNFNPRSPCGERQLAGLRDLFLNLFQSTLPMRGATMLWSNILQIMMISIHAPHAGSDTKDWPDASR